MFTFTARRPAPYLVYFDHAAVALALVFSLSRPHLLDNSPPPIDQQIVALPTGTAALALLCRVYSVALAS
jgi:hypothetical protein